MKDMIVYKYENGHKFYDQATGLEIVNATDYEVTGIVTCGNQAGFASCKPFEHNSSFPLPSNLKFEEVGYCEACKRAGMYNCAQFDTCGAITVLRLVKVENCPKCRTTDFKSCHSMHCPMREVVVENGKKQTYTRAEVIECIKASLAKAAENVRLDFCDENPNHENYGSIDKSSITDETNIVLL